MYTIYDNKGYPHNHYFDDDSSALLFLKSRFIDYIVSVLSSDPIVIVRPNGYILAYINTATGEQTVKTMFDWVR